MSKFGDRLVCRSCAVRRVPIFRDTHIILAHPRWECPVCKDGVLSEASGNISRSIWLTYKRRHYTYVAKTYDEGSVNVILDIPRR